MPRSRACAELVDVEQALDEQEAFAIGAGRGEPVGGQPGAGGAA